MPNRTTERQMRVSKIGHTNHDRQESTGGNTGLAKVAVQCSADQPRLMINHPPRRVSASIRQLADGENRHLRQARNRCVPFYRDAPKPTN
jgi:hypothetical protein